MTKAEIGALLDAAHAARRNAYAPYSDFLVGAALLSRDGRIWTGCNMENASFGATVCAERVALGAAIAAGVREFSAIAIVGGRAGTRATEPCFPCGICRQVLSELCSPDLPVYLEGADGAVEYTLGALLPFGFSLEERK